MPIPFTNSNQTPFHTNLKQALQIFGSSRHVLAAWRKMEFVYQACICLFLLLQKKKSKNFAAFFSLYYTFFAFFTSATKLRFFFLSFKLNNEVLRDSGACRSHIRVRLGIRGHVIADGRGCQGDLITAWGVEDRVGKTLPITRGVRGFKE